MSVWCNNTWTNYNAPVDVSSIAFWVRPENVPAGEISWKPILTDYDNYPIKADHLYKVRVVWDSNKIGSIPGDIFVDDQGTDGNGLDEDWQGYKNATDIDQSQLTTDRFLHEGDKTLSAEGAMHIGTNANRNLLFSGLIDWITWKPDTDYTGLDDPPYGSSWP